MPKSIVVSLGLLLSLSAVAGTPVKSITEAAQLPNVTQIERAITLDTAFEKGRLSIIETDNGGSTDAGSVVAPSQMYLTYYSDGEMQNYAAAFDLGHVYSVDSVKSKKKGSDVYVVQATFVNIATNERYKREITVDVSGLRQGIRNTTTSNEEEFGTVYVDATISLN
jgi:hypothetical protein